MSKPKKPSERDVHLAKLAQAFFENLRYGETGYGGGEIGHVGLDFKRPFGNQDVAGDILEIVGAEMEGDDGDAPCWSSGQRRYAAGLLEALPRHLQTKFAKGKSAR